MLSILIIEDEPQAARRLERQIGELCPNANFLPRLDSVSEAISFFENPPSVDLIFMDIQLADGDSFEILEQVAIPAPIIFTTAFDAYALQAFKANSIDYLLKPVKLAELGAAIDKWEQRRQEAVLSPTEMARILEAMTQGTQSDSHHLRRILIRLPERLKALEISAAAYFYIESRITMIQLHDGKRYPIDFNLDQLSQRIDMQRFFRVNRKFLVSYDAIRQMYTYNKSRLRLELFPAVEEEVFVSSEKSSAFKRWLMEA